MMMNTSIIYHIESILEMQFLCLIGFALYGYQDFEGKPNAENHIRAQEGSASIITALICEHIFAYISMYFRKWEIQRYGVMDINGIYRAPKEYILQTVEIFIDCMIFGFSINHIIDNKEFLHDEPYINYWIITDCILMFITLAYTYVGTKWLIFSEIKKNIFTLFFVQSKIIKNDNLSKKLKIN